MGAAQEMRTNIYGAKRFDPVTSEYGGVKTND
jgi:hypothetical protein